VTKILRGIKTQHQKKLRSSTKQIRIKNSIFRTFIKLQSNNFMKKSWDNIKESDVIKAIKLFDERKENHPEPRNTFLIYENEKYPAKHIRGLAYYVANKTEISKSEYSGGQETANFFKKLGFTVQYKEDSILPKAVVEKKVIQDSKIISVSKKLNVVSQKNALQMLCQKHLGHIETEKKFDWLKTPDHNSLPKEYKAIVSALIEYRNQGAFQKSNYQLLCDIVLDKQKLIFEYDENQHFSKARKIVLENYSNDIQLNYSKASWISACDKINAKDNNPIDRDEKRAYYDAVRDIEAYKNGYTLIRIKHGEIDWEAEGADDHLKKILELSRSEIKIEKNKIARLIVTKNQYENDKYPNSSEPQGLLSKFVMEVHKKKKFEFILTPGGFLTFGFPKSLQDIEIKDAEQEKHITVFQSAANEVITDFFKNKVKEQTFQKLKEIADYFTIGIDGFNPQNTDKSIELVAIYDLKKEEVIRWTGKFYPTSEFQKRNLVKINDIETHFIKLNDENVVILGCHDLNVYNPRGQASANPEGWKKQLADKFKKKCKAFAPTIILQHPHTTDTPNIWKLSWGAVRKELPNVSNFASGINYYNSDGERGELDDVLEQTKKGDVTDYYFAKRVQKPKNTERSQC
jgi:hypothetical protein